MAELLNNPEIMAKVQQELKDVVGMNNIVEESHLPNLHYLDAVLKETLHLHPALPLLLPKRPSQSAVVGGYTIPEGTRVFLNVYAIHRDPQVWESPLKFQPERFLSRSTNLDYARNNMKYVPFGSGRRICAGIPLAEKNANVYKLLCCIPSIGNSLREKTLTFQRDLDLSSRKARGYSPSLLPGYRILSYISKAKKLYGA